MILSLLLALIAHYYWETLYRLFIPRVDCLTSEILIWLTAVSDAQWDNEQIKQKTAYRNYFYEIISAFIIHNYINLSRPFKLILCLINNLLKGLSKPRINFYPDTLKTMPLMASVILSYENKWTNLHETTFTTRFTIVIFNCRISTSWY